MKILLLSILLCSVLAVPIEKRDVADPPRDDEVPVRRSGVLNTFKQFANVVKTATREAISTVADVVEGNGLPLDHGFQFSCTTCTFGVNLIMSYVRNNRSPESIAKTAISICTTFKIESEVVCKGAVEGFVHEIVYILKNNPELTESDVCGFALGPKCEGRDFEKKFNWTVEIPPGKPPVAPIVSPPDGAPTKLILHLSDTHLDPLYKEGSDALCGLPICCRDSPRVTINPEHRAGKWGDYRNCDIPVVTVENMLQHISQTHKVDYIFWTGDLPPHDVYNQTKDGNKQLIKLLTNLMKKYFPNTPVFPALGNHETAPVNCFPPPEIEGEHSISWLYKDLGKSWSQILHTNVSKTVEKGAYYSVLVSPGLRIISLNMNYCNNKNWWLLMNSKDPADELKWLVDELLKSEINKEKVYILGHIPPGSSDCTRVWSRNYHDIVNRFENTIAAQFFGHTHFDEHLLFYDESNQRPTSIAYVGASITPYSFLNPAYKLYTADGDRPNSTRMILDGSTHYTNLTEANEYELPIWRKLYSYKDAYNMNSLTPADWDLHFRKMVQDQFLFEKYLTHMHRDCEFYPECDAACRVEHTCRQVQAKSQDFKMCRALGILSETATIKGPALLA